jgi:hypothetical protein
MTCFECGSAATEKHHVVPRVLGGANTINLCSKCHCKVHGFKGNRINAVDLIKLGIYRKQALSILAIMAWDVFNMRYNFSLKKGDSWSKARYRSYQLFSGDYKLTKGMFESRLKLIDEWVKDKKWDWFIQLVDYDLDVVAKVLMVKILNDHYKVKTYNRILKREWLPHAIGKINVPKKIDWDFTKIDSDVMLWKNETDYEDYVLRNIWESIDNKETRYSPIKRKQSETELEYLAELEKDRQDKLAADRIGRFFGSMFF